MTTNHHSMSSGSPNPAQWLNSSRVPIWLGCVMSKLIWIWSSLGSLGQTRTSTWSSFNMNCHIALSSSSRNGASSGYVSFATDCPTKSKKTSSIWAVDRELLAEHYRSGCAVNIELWHVNILVLFLVLVLVELWTVFCPTHLGPFNIPRSGEPHQFNTTEYTPLPLDIALRILRRIRVVATSGRWHG